LSHVVVDASVAAKWVLNEPDSEAARRIFERGPLLAPDLLWAELGSLPWRRQRVGEFSVADARLMLLDLRKLPVKSYAINPLLPLAFEIALAIDHSVYDCVYLALADPKAVVLLLLIGACAMRSPLVRWPSRSHRRHS
jgi:predicted nucleic acid-binding protein